MDIVTGYVSFGYLIYPGVIMLFDVILDRARAESLVHVKLMSKYTSQIVEQHIFL